MIPYTPSFTIAALITAETWLGASGWARGSQTWSGTSPALVAKPMSSNRKAAIPVGPVIWAAEIWVNVVLWALLATRAKPVARLRKLRCVITAYQTAAVRTAGRSA